MGIIEVQHFLSAPDELFELKPHDNCLPVPPLRRQILLLQHCLILLHGGGPQLEQLSTLPAQLCSGLQLLLSLIARE